MSDLLEFRHLKYLIAVGEEANISRAAKRLYLAQPSLSTQIKSLEEALLIPLLVRGRKGIEITPAAAILITGAHEILKLRDELIATARAVQRTHLEPLRLGFSPFVDHALLQMVCETHKSLFPDCEITPKNGSHVELLSLLESGEIDAALLTLPVSRTDMATYPFTHRRLMVCMKANAPLASRREVSPSELEGKLTIFREPKQHPEGHRQLMEMLEAANIRPEVAKTTATPHDLQWMVESGFGYALIQEGTELHSGLVTRPVAGANWTVDSALIVKKSASRKTLPYLVRELRKRVRLQVSTPPGKPPRSVPPSTKDQSLDLFG